MPTLVTLVDGTIPVAADFNGNYQALNNAIGSSTVISSWAVGEMPYASATNTLAKLSPGSVNQILTMSGGVPAWANNPAVFDRSVATQDVASSAALTSVYTKTITGSTLSTNRKLRLTLIGDYLQNAGGNTTFTGTYGATQIFSTNFAPGNDANRRLIKIVVELAANNGASNQVSTVDFTAGATSSSGTPGTVATVTGVTMGMHNALTENSALDKDLKVEVQHSTSSSSLSYRRFTAHLELI